jgi:hypothetical protein
LGSLVSKSTLEELKEEASENAAKKAIENQIEARENKIRMIKALPS